MEQGKKDGGKQGEEGVLKERTEEVEEEDAGKLEETK